MANTNNTFPLPTAAGEKARCPHKDVKIEAAFARLYEDTENPETETGHLLAVWVICKDCLGAFLAKDNLAFDAPEQSIEVPKLAAVIKDGTERNLLIPTGISIAPDLVQVRIPLIAPVRFIEKERELPDDFPPPPPNSLGIPDVIGEALRNKRKETNEKQQAYRAKRRGRRNG